MLQKLKSTKLLAAFCLTILFTTLLTKAYITEETFSNFLVMVWGYFFASNVVSKFSPLGKVTAEKLTKPSEDNTGGQPNLGNEK